MGLSRKTAEMEPFQNGVPQLPYFSPINVGIPQVAELFYCLICLGSMARNVLGGDTLFWLTFCNFKKSRFTLSRGSLKFNVLIFLLVLSVKLLQIPVGFCFYVSGFCF